MKKIISFSLWGSHPRYLVGALENAKLRASIYPDWTCRFYVDSTVPPETLSKLTDLGCELVRKPDSIGYRGLFWRFEPGMDDAISRFIVRDADSRISYREADAVQEWEESGLPFHAMRDHRGHDIPVLGGMWGAISNFVPEYKMLFQKYMNMVDEEPYIKREKYFYTDQLFLNRVIWPLVKDKSIIHDDLARFNHNEKPFRIKLLPGQFIGQQWDEFNKPFEVPQ